MSGEHKHGEQQLSQELAEAKEQLLDFFDRFGDIYFWDLGRKARAVSITAMLTNFLVSINAGFIAKVQPKTLSLDFEIAQWTYQFTAFCALYYFALSVFAHISFVKQKYQKAILYGVLASLSVTLAVFGSLMGFFDNTTWFIFFLYTMLGFVLLDWRQVVITDFCIIFGMILISVFHEALPFPVQAYLFSHESHYIGSMSFLDLLVAWTITVTAAVSGMWIMSFLLRNWHAHGVEHVSFAHLDPLTKVMKRSAILHLLEDEVLAAAREQQPLTVAVIDMDKFRALNADYGHVIGDQVLTHFARLLTEVSRKGDFVGRYGGQEFMIVFPRCRSEVAVQVLERLKAIISDDNFAPIEGKKFRLSFSSGIAYLRPGDSKFENVIARADLALADAKAKGGNQILVHGE